MRAKVSLALSMWRIMYAESMTNLLALMMHFPFYGIHVAANFRVDRSRELITEAFLKTAGTHMFCVDSDMEIPLDAIQRLLAHEKPIVGGLYVSRREEHWPFVWQELRDEEGRFLDFEVAADWPENALVKCDITGSGFLLVERKVFEAFGPPWWILDESDEGGTDIAFLRRAREAGIKVYVDTSLQAGHYGTAKFTLDDFCRWRDEHPERIIEREG